MSQRHRPPAIAHLRIRRDSQYCLGRLPPPSRLGLHVPGELGESHGRILRVQPAHLLQSLGQILGLPVPPHLVYEAVVEKEEGVAGGGYAVAVLMMGLGRGGCVF